MKKKRYVGNIDWLIRTKTPHGSINAKRYDVIIELSIHKTYLVFVSMSVPKYRVRTEQSPLGKRVHKFKTALFSQ